jgi:hypothetical protein
MIAATQQRALIAVMAIALLMFAAILFVTCAPGDDGRKQACANADKVLIDAYQIDTAAMRDAIAKRRAAALAPLFHDVTTTLNEAKKTKDDACADPPPTGKDIPQLVADVTAAVANATAAMAKLRAALNAAPSDGGK